VMVIGLSPNRGMRRLSAPLSGLGLIAAAVLAARTTPLTATALATAFLVLFGAITSQLPDVPVVLTGLSIAYLAYYVGISLWLTLRTGSSVAPAVVEPAP